jgi:hypothetical protein
MGSDGSFLNELRLLAEGAPYKPETGAGVAWSIPTAVLRQHVKELPLSVGTAGRSRPRLQTSSQSDSIQLR